MKRIFRKIAVSALAFALTAGVSLSAAAEEAVQNNSADTEPVETPVKPEVYQVVLPTETDVNDTFDFILDPQRLIEETNAAAYGGTGFEKGATMFFHRTDGQNAEEYSSSSDYVTIVNRSNVPVEVQVDVDILPESLGGIVLSGDRGFTDDDSTSIYMALTDGEYTVPVQTGGSFIRTTIPAAPDTAFEFRYDLASRQYVYGLRDDLDSVQFPEYSFQLTGAVNEKGDWKALGKVSPVVNVTWRVTPIHMPDPGEEKDAEPMETEEDISQEESLIIKEILETVPVKEDNADEELEQEDSEYKQENPELKQEDSEYKQENPKLKQEDSEYKQENPELKQKDQKPKQEDQKFEQENLELKQEDLEQN